MTSNQGNCKARRKSRCQENVDDKPIGVRLVGAFAAAGLSVDDISAATGMAQDFVETILRLLEAEAAHA